ncbi:hypothetical protein [Kitasatospora sp. NPDC047058]|uniref:hypothetical protein n=1 Tax=Kitasatospora sp. NPDC047058 TaxID=3155620 RepID=UPI0033D92942
MSTITAGLPLGGLLGAVWLRHRTALLTVLAVLAGVCALLLVSGLYVHAGYRSSGAAACDPSLLECNRVWKDFIRGWGAPLMVGNTVLYLFGGAVGAFVGGPLVAREFEYGTFRFAWTQGAGRSRFTVGGLALAGTVLAGATALVGVVLAWWNEPMARQGGRFSPALFVEGAPALAGRALLAFGCAALAGAVLRRTVVAVGAGLVASVAVTFVAEAMRFHYRTPLEDTVHTLMQTSVDQRWTGSTWFSDPAGNRIGSDALFDLGKGFDDAERLVRDGGYAVHEVYQPADRYWSFQAVEFGWMALLGLAACAGAVWWLRRRAA